MPGPIFLEGDQLELRIVQSEDYAFIAEDINNPAVRHGGFEAIRKPLSEEKLANRVEESDDAHVFLVCIDGQPVGGLELLDVDFEGRKAELGYWITPDQQGNGYATEAAELGLEHAFDELGLHKVWARTIHDNESAKRVLEKLGFQQEGVLREHWRGYDRYVDEIRWGLLNSER